MRNEAQKRPEIVLRSEWLDNNKVPLKRTVEVGNNYGSATRSSSVMLSVVATMRLGDANVCVLDETVRT